MLGLNFVLCSWVFKETLGFVVDRGMMNLTIKLCIFVPFTSRVSLSQQKISQKRLKKTWKHFEPSFPLIDVSTQNYVHKIPFKLKREKTPKKSSSWHNKNLCNLNNWKLSSETKMEKSLSNRNFPLNIVSLRSFEPFSRY